MNGMTRHTIGIVVAAAAAIGLFLVYFDVTPKHAAIVSPPTSARYSQCAEAAFTSYLKTNLALSQQRQELIPSVPSIIAHRRRQEQFCLQFARCILAEEAKDLSEAENFVPLVFATTFDSCLRDEALEEYGAKIQR
jgi:hypothetical protein